MGDELPRELPQITTKEAMRRVAAIDEKIDKLTKALNPRVRGVAIEPDMDHETTESMIDLKIELRQQRQEAAILTRMLSELERCDPHRGCVIQRDRRKNAANLAAAIGILDDGLRC